MLYEAGIFITHLLFYSPYCTSFSYILSLSPYSPVPSPAIVVQEFYCFTKFFTRMLHMNKVIAIRGEIFLTDPFLNAQHAKKTCKQHQEQKHLLFSLAVIAALFFNFQKFVTQMEQHCDRFVEVQRILAILSIWASQSLLTEYYPWASPWDCLCHTSMTNKSVLQSHISLESSPCFRIIWSGEDILRPWNSKGI